ncbi:MAG: hypothetical protein ACHREM_05855 [Polyangiales bacterium]
MACVHAAYQLATIERISRNARILREGLVLMLLQQIRREITA